MEELQELITVQNDCHGVIKEGKLAKSQLLCEAVLLNDVRKTQELMLESNEDDFLLTNSTENCKNIINLACKVESILEDVFETLMSHVCNTHPEMQWSESQWYYWEPIHFAAYSLNLKKLKILLNSYNKARINALTVFSENALHVLLEYGKRIDSYKAHLTNGWESRVCNIIAKEKDDLIECSKILISSGVDVNHTNIWGETPIMVAIKNGYHGIIKLLLQQKHIDLKSRNIKNDQEKSVQDFIKENDLSYEFITLPVSSENPSKILFDMLKIGSEELFLRYNNGNIRQYSNLSDGDSDINTSGNMLQLCFLKGYLEVLKDRSSKETTDLKDLINSKPIRIFISKGYGKCIEHLLNNGADLKWRNRMFDFLNLIEVSVKFCYFPFLIVLLEHSSNYVCSDDIFDVLEKHSKGLLESRHPEVVHVLFILFSKLENLLRYNKFSADFDLINYRRKTVLENTMHLCLKYNQKNEFTDVILKSLKLGAPLSNSNSKSIEPFNILDAATIEKYLDECVLDDNEMNFDSLIIDSRTQYSETKILQSFVRDKIKIELLNHPVLIYLTHRKWLKTKNFFYLDIFLYVLFLVSLYTYMVNLHINNLTNTVSWIFNFFLYIHILKEFSQLCFFQYRYFMDIVNYLEVLVLVFSLISCFTQNEVAIVLSILLATVTFLYMLGQIPRFTKYMIIVSSTKYFFEYALFYFIQFFAFALCFLVLLPPEEGVSRTNALSEIFKHLFNCLIYFIGQFDGDVAHPPHFPIFGRIIVALFAFCMTIILNNLLVGLIVTDMDTIQKTAKLLRQVKIIKYIIRTELFLNNIKKFLLFKRLKIIQDTNIFTKGHCKHMSYKDAVHTKSVFDDDDKDKLKQILEQNALAASINKYCLRNLYQHIVTESFSENRFDKGNKYILAKLHQLEGALSRRSVLH